ncbi:MAG TPA: Gfo/Idh/MocA family oxidoreductase [bacterium]|nr:Gfo/Idh/MocA family oxidoreductase [bacterium]
MSGGDDVKVAVVGVGRWGLNHLAKLVPLLGPERVAFYDADAERARAAGERYPEVAALRSWEEFLKGGYKAAIIAAPASHHAELAGAALAAGKDLLVEKPLALTPPDAAALVRLAEEKKAVLMVGHILLFDPAFEALKDAIAAGELGDIKYMTAARAKLGTIRLEEDVTFSLAAHDVALALWLLEDEPASASAVAVDARGAGVADAAFLNLSFSGGVTAHVWASWLYPLETRRFVVVGDEAMAAVIQEEGGRGELTVYRMGARGGGAEVYDDGSSAVEVPVVDLLEAELGHFLECVATRATPRADGRQGLDVVKVLAAAQKSAAAGGGPVRLEN